MTLDRVDNHTHVRRRFPRYHSTLFRGQALWDAHTHVVLPPTAFVPQRNLCKLHTHLNIPFWVCLWLNKSVKLKPVISAPSPAGPVNLLANQTVEATAARRSMALQEAPVTIVIMLIYRGLGAALPPKYHTDRRGVRCESVFMYISDKYTPHITCDVWFSARMSLSCRLPRHPVLNSPVVSVSVYNNQTFVEGFLDTPILLEFRLLETSNRSKPLCVQWNHSSP